LEGKVIKCEFYIHGVGCRKEAEFKIKLKNGVEIKACPSCKDDYQQKKSDKIKEIVEL